MSKFRKGDVVDLLPYDEVSGTGYPRARWEAMRSRGPKVVAEVWGEMVRLCYFQNFLYSWQLEHHHNVIKVGDLL